ncbi:hypothetical protein EVG20_g10878 [Dentipellis fragilis]|uniref:F-box domain-containing protein n=1 Tax=Dentipellis fragilis TaxID=205917 RepID=A0A4Y9XNM3_9AGAM|nr:hypothetical protein EVG20_g10878 [Dentipellis fragilis]
MEPRNMLLKLPMELLVMILRRLSVKEFLQVAMTCKSLHNLVMETARLRYEIELAISDLHDDEHSTIDLRERLRLLLERRARWRSLSYKQHVAFTFPCFGLPGENKEFNVLRDVLFANTETFDPLALVMSQIPTAFYDSVSTIDGRDVKIDNFSGRQPHPKCSNSVLNYEFESNFWDRCRINSMIITGNSIGVHAYDGLADCIEIWDWLEGELCIISADGFSSTVFLDLCLLSPTEFIVINSISEEQDMMYLHLFTLTEELQGYTDWERSSNVRYCLRLALPRLASANAYIRTTCACTGPFARTCPDPVPFPRAGQSGVFAFRLHTYASFGVETATNFLFFVQSRDLRKNIDRYAAWSIIRTTIRIKPGIVPWSDWGPAHTRLFAQELPSQDDDPFPQQGGTYEPSQGWLHGTRAVCTVVDPRLPQGPLVTQVLDFNTCDRHRPLISISTVAEDCTPTEAVLVTEPTTIDRPDVFRDPVTTRLPYYTTYVKDSPLFAENEGQGAMMLGERLYGLKEHLPAQLSDPVSDPKENTVDIDVYSF